MISAFEPMISQSAGCVARTDRKSERAFYRLCDTLTLRCPVVQAPLGGCDGPRLAAAVSRAGALGCLTIHEISEARLRRRLARVRALTPRPILIAFTAQWQRESVLDICREFGFAHFLVFWWNGPRLSPMIRASGGTTFYQAGTTDQATEALQAGADVLVAQGTDAGGPVRSPYSAEQLLNEFSEMTRGRTPIVAGGGLADARDVAAILTQGARAALMGTRFLLSEEAQVASRCKVRLQRATTDNLQLDKRIIGEWPCAPRRYLRTALGEDTPGLYAGRGLSRINDLSPAAEIVRRLIPTIAPR